MSQNLNVGDSKILAARSSGPADRLEGKIEHLNIVESRRLEVMAFAQLRSNGRIIDISFFPAVYSGIRDKLYATVGKEIAVTGHWDGDSAEGFFVADGICLMA